MSVEIRLKEYTPPPFDDGEILRYAKCTRGSEELIRLLNLAKEDARGLCFRVLYSTLPVKDISGGVRLGELELCSKELKAALCGCARAVIFVATVGAQADRLIAKYSRIAPARALITDALCTERVEALCDTFCKELSNAVGKTTARFSPGYGDLSLEYQRDIFKLLQCEKRIGVCLSENLLMTPTKTVSAIVGIL